MLYNTRANKAIKSRNLQKTENYANLTTAILGPSRSDSGLTFDRVSQGAGRWRQEGSIFFGAEVYILLRSKYFFERSFWLAIRTSFQVVLSSNCITVTTDFAKTFYKLEHSQVEYLNVQERFWTNLNKNFRSRVKIKVKNFLNCSYTVRSKTFRHCDDFLFFIPIVKKKRTEN